MEIWKHIAVVGLAALGLVGCTPTPEETCQKLEDLSKTDPYGFKLSWSKCLTRMNEIKDRDSSAYRCAAKGIKGTSSIDTALLLVSICDKNGPSAEKKKKDKDKDDDEPKSSSKTATKKGGHASDD